MSTLTEAAAAFRAWAKELDPSGERLSGEWETEFEDWTRIYQAIAAFVRTTRLADATDGEVADLLYIIARDNECETIASDLVETWPLVDSIALTRRARTEGEPDARWQLANELGNVAIAADDPLRSTVERLLTELHRDPEEYVSRRALGALGAQRFASAEPLALAAFDAPESKPWMRMMAITVLEQLGSSHLPRLLARAAADPDTSMADFLRRRAAP